MQRIWNFHRKRFKHYPNTRLDMRCWEKTWPLNVILLQRRLSQLSRCLVIFVETQNSLLCLEMGLRIFPVIGEKIKLWERDGTHKFVFGFEESCGYLRGTHARDKDAVVASMLCAEMVCYYASLNKTVYQRLMEIYDTYGYVLDCNVSIPFSGLNAMSEMNAVVDRLKTEPVKKFDIYDVDAVRDYSKNIRTDCNGNKTEIGSPLTNCVYYELENGSFICVRPSGTEPKLKIYFSVKAHHKADAEAALEKMKAAVNKLIK